MMLYPNVQEMTNDKINRYMLVIAAAKCARRITDKVLEEAELADEKNETKAETEEMELAGEKPVTMAIQEVARGELTATLKEKYLK